jgi:hydroxymethylpyrimidine pyrophosphatase-like HAD family hydrolase
MTIAVDFDHTLIQNDKPLPGAREAMQKLWELGHYILIYSCNTKEYIERTLNRYDIPYHEIYGNKGGKPVCAVYIDDRAVGYAGDWMATLTEALNIEKRREKIKELN